jgi:energy-coupling factor transporter ATP-binding protein EcfA2
MERPPNRRPDTTRHLSRQSWLEIHGVRFNSHGRQILDDLSLSFRPGELTLLVGRNGCGKTTLLKILAGLLRPDGGRFIYQGTEKTWPEQRKFLQQEVCYLHQEPYLFDTSVFDNVAYGLRCRKASAETVQLLVQRALEASSMGHLAGRHARQLSGGEKQRVAMARAWVLSPKLMLLDEPLANMDQESRHQCRQLILQLQDSGMGIMLTSHEGRHKGLRVTRHLKLSDGKLTPRSPPPAKGRIIPLKTGN